MNAPAVPSSALGRYRKRAEAVLVRAVLVSLSSMPKGVVGDHGSIALQLVKIILSMVHARCAKREGCRPVFRSEPPF